MPSLSTIIINNTDFTEADAKFLLKWQNDPRKIVEFCIAQTGSIKKAFIFLVWSIVFKTTNVTQEIKNFLTINASIPLDEIKKLAHNCLASKLIVSQLKVIRDKLQNANPTPTTTSNTTPVISNKIKNPANHFCRIVVYDTKYGGSGARRHIYLRKKMGNQYKVSLGASTTINWYDEPLFETYEQAEEFIKNLNKINTKVDISSFRYSITDAPIQVYSNKYIADLSDAVEVDTICGKAFMHKKSKYCEESLNMNNKDLSSFAFDTALFEEINDKEVLKLKSKIKNIINKYNDEAKSRMTLLDQDEKHDWITKFEYYPELGEEESERFEMEIAGGLNGPGHWENYLQDISHLFKDLKSETGWEPVIVDLDNDVCDDIFYIRVNLFNIPTTESLHEDLIVIEPEAAKVKLEKLIDQIKYCEDDEVKKSLVTLLNIYLFQTYEYDPETYKERGYDITKDEWEEYSDFKQEITKELDDLTGEESTAEATESLNESLDNYSQAKALAKKYDAELASTSYRKFVIKLDARLSGYNKCLEDAKKIWPQEGVVDTGFSGIILNFTNLRESLTEGCWGMPYTLEGANKLKNLMAKPVDAFEVGDHIDNKNDELGIGDDTLFDNIANYRKEHGYGTEASDDVRKVIQDFIKDEVLPNWDSYSYSQPEGDHEGHTWENGVKEVFQEIADMDLSDKADEIRKNAEEHDADDFPPEVEDEVPLEEAIEKHDTLNPKFFENGKLKQDIREKIEEIVNEFLKLLKDDELQIAVRDVVFTGSNASYNYTKDSDVDVHIIANTMTVEGEQKLLNKLYNAYRRIFANKYQVSFYGIPVELYVETESTPVVSNGIYSVMYDKWVKEPTQDYVPEVDQKHIDEVTKPWKEEAEELIKKVSENNSEGEEDIDNFITKLYELRQQGLYHTEGAEFSDENLIFKELRNQGYIEKLRLLRDKIVSTKLSLQEAAHYLDDEKKFINYGTADIEGDDVIDTTKASTFGTQDLLDGSDDATYEGLISEIIPMTPMQYFELCGKLQSEDPNILINWCEEDTERSQHIADVILKFHKKLPMPYISFTKHLEVGGQEGRHRMYVLGELFGWDKQFPVQVIQDIAIKKSLPELLGESLTEAFDERTRREYITKIMQITHIQPIVQPNGIFEVYNIKEDEVQFIVANLRRQDWVEYVTYSAERYDFSKMPMRGIPARYFCIRGKIRS